MLSNDNKDLAKSLKLNENAIKPCALIMAYPVVSVKVPTNSLTAQIITDNFNKELVDLLALTEHTLPKSVKRDKLTLYTKNSQLVEGNSTYNPDLACSRLGYNEKARYCVASMTNHKGNNIKNAISFWCNPICTAF